MSRVVEVCIPRWILKPEELPNHLTAAGRFEWERAVRDLDLDVAPKFVAIVLATYANQDGSNVRPSQARLAAVTGYSTRHVRRALAELRGLGLIYRLHSGSNSGRANYADVYRLTVASDHLDRVEISGGV